MSDDNVSYEMGYEGLDAMFAGDDEPPLPPSPDSPTEQQHSSFLDLTNGEGGAKKRRSTSRYATYPAAPEEDSDSDDGGGRSTPPPARRKKAEPPAAAADSNTTATPGKVVPPGQEATGRWTQEEHQAFLNGLRMYGKEWKKVAAKVKTRTVVQTRTHAQKYFQKLHKAMETGDTSEITSVDMGVAADVKKASEKKKAKRAQSAKLKREQSTASTHAAANLMGLSNTKMESSEATSNATFGQPTESLPTHGFSTHQGHSPMAGYTSSGLFDSPGMKILAPQHDMAMRMGKFPEPSPAATGKRKLAEMAAAQMLAGVTSTFSMPPMLPGVDDGDVTPPEEGTGAVARFPSLPPLYQGQEEEPAAKKSALSLQILNPETLGIAHDTKANRGGAESPTTPWDGQLEALLSEAKEKGEEQLTQDSLDAPDELMIPVDDGYLQSPRALPVCDSGGKYGRSLIHELVCKADYTALERELGSEGFDRQLLQKRDEAGFCPIHSACALPLLDQDNMALSLEIVRLLLSAGAEVGTTDSKGNTPLHWAARAGNSEVVRTLVLKNCPLDNQNEAGDTALHWAMRAGSRGMGVVRVLVESGAHSSILNNNCRRPLDVAVTGFDEFEGDAKKPAERKTRTNKRKRKELVREIRDVRANLIALSHRCRTLVLHHPECLEHIPKSEADWEVPDRVESIMRRVLPNPETGETTGIFPHEVLVSSDFERASLELLSRIHSHDYLSFVNDLSKELEKRKQEMGSEQVQELGGGSHAVPFTPMVQKSVLKLDNIADVKQSAHSDTSFSAGSLRAARRAAGAVQHAVDCVLVGRHRNAFCVVRPPGHHAGIKGLLAGGESCGFCIFNNVAAGALHAVSDERQLCKKVAIVDIDVHHGNGTEEIVRKCDDPGKLLFFSIHLFDNDKKKSRSNIPPYKFYPGTGEEDDLPHNIINVPIMPLWKEEISSPPPPAAAHGRHNTRQKSKRVASNGSANSSPSKAASLVGDDSSTDLGGALGSSSADIVRASDTDSETASKRDSQRSVTPGPDPRYGATGRMAYRRAIQDRLLPALRAFNPDLILISAGFDAGKGDVGNAKHMIGVPERMGLDLEPEDYAWTTRKILEVADICCQGRVVSVLEGGYGRTPLAPAAEGDRRLDRTLFSEAAIRHLQAMIDPYDAEERFSSS